MVNQLTPEERLARAEAIGVLVDTEDEWILSAYTWRISTKGYVETSIYAGPWRCTAKLHHFIIGRPIDGSVVDHKDRNKLNNTRANLRYVDESTSMRNIERVLNATNIRVTYNGRFEVRVRHDGETIQIGTYRTEQEAQDARDEWFRTKA